jgi:hypothetical protein
LPPYFSPIIFWFFTHKTSPPQGAATYCAPAISVFEVDATVDMNNGNLTSVVEIQPFNASTSSLASLSQNMTGTFLNGQAFNGIVFSSTNLDPFTISKLNVTTLQLSASILQVAAKALGGLQAAFQANNFTDATTLIYVSS